MKDTFVMQSVNGDRIGWSVNTVDDILPVDADENLFETLQGGALASVDQSENVMDIDVPVQTRDTVLDLMLVAEIEPKIKHTEKRSFHVGHVLSGSYSTPFVRPMYAYQDFCWQNTSDIFGCLQFAFPYLTSAIQENTPTCIDEAVRIIYCHTNYIFCELYKVSNIHRKYMFQALVDSFDNKKTMFVFHGTTWEDAKKIAVHGFMKHPLPKRQKGYTGIYFSRNIFHALFHAIPDKETGLQTVVLSEILVGTWQEHLCGQIIYDNSSPKVKPNTIINSVSQSYCKLDNYQTKALAILRLTYDVSRKCAGNVCFNVGTRLNPCVLQRISADE